MTISYEMSTTAYQVIKSIASMIDAAIIIWILIRLNKLESKQ